MLVQVGLLVFVKARAGSRVFVQADADQEEAYDIAKTISRGRIRRVDPS